MIEKSKPVLHGAISLASCLASWKKKSIASCRRNVTRCNLELQLAMVSKQSMQSLQKVERSSTLCNLYKTKKVAKQVAKRTFYTLQPICTLSYNAIATQVAKKIAPCNTRFFPKKDRVELSCKWKLGKTWRRPGCGIRERLKRMEFTRAWIEHENSLVNISID